MKYLTVSLLLIASACGGGGSSSPTSPSTGGSPVATTAIAISSSGAVTPNNIQVAVGATVTLTNNDARAHDMDSDPHPDHTTCPQINWGLVQPGQSRTSAPLTTARTCGFHDHDQPTNTALQGTIRIQ